MVKSMKVLCTVAVLSASILGPAVSWSAVEKVSGATVTKLLQDSVNYGGCMARLSKDLVDEGLNCTNDPMVTFDCLGTLGGAKSVGNTMFSSAQLAFVAGVSVDVFVDDARKINGFCYAKRIDLR